MLTSTKNDLLELPLRVSKKEFKIITAESNILLLGRSGTGKTTCAILRMWSRLKACQEKSKEFPLFLGKKTSSSTYADEASYYHPLFVTMSPILSGHVYQNFQGLKAAYGEPPIAALPENLLEVCFPVMRSLIVLNRLMKKLGLWLLHLVVF